MKPIIIPFIFARGGSKGLKKKNLLKFNKSSLLGNAILQAKKVKYAKEVYVSTDSLKIKNEALKYKAQVPFIRPKHLSTDSVAEIYAWRHAINFLNKKLNIYPDYIVSVPTTSPLRKVSDINKCLALAIKKKLDVVFSITESAKNPFFNMLIERGKKKQLILKKNKKITRRQDAPKCYDMTTVCYVFKPNYIKKNFNLFAGKVGYVKVPKERAIDIDDKWDYKIATALSQHKV
ncbi:acylneuraminate cytidylyltransferase family protein [Pelagibacteraceae bacterium]|nr:acylneuraminate cytidylyltransferase family protein [Pelagibacteraceae bacterium]